MPNYLRRPSRCKSSIAKQSMIHLSTSSRQIATRKTESQPAAVQLQQQRQRQHYQRHRNRWENQTSNNERQKSGENLTPKANWWPRPNKTKRKQSFSELFIFLCNLFVPLPFPGFREHVKPSTSHNLIFNFFADHINKQNSVAVAEVPPVKFRFAIPQNID